jgi:hypothetical protein
MRFYGMQIQDSLRVCTGTHYSVLLFIRFFTRQLCNEQDEFTNSSNCVTFVLSFSPYQD